MVPPDPGHCIEHGRKLSAEFETLENEIPGNCFAWFMVGFMMSEDENLFFWNRFPVRPIGPLNDET